MKDTVESLSHRYLWQPDAVDQLLADEQLLRSANGQGNGGQGRDKGHDLSVPGTVVWALADHLGTIRDLAVYDQTTGVTTVANHRIYDSFGNLTSQTNAAVDCLFGFTGRPLDNVTGLQNNLNRWYDAKVGQWASEDPIGFNGRDANTSRYVGNSPTNAVDPSGLDRRIIGWLGFHFMIEIRDPKTGVSQYLDFGPGWFGGGSGGYSVYYGYYTPGKVVLSPWIKSTPEQDQELIELWQKLEFDRVHGNVWSWNPINNCWVPILRYRDYGIPETKLPPTQWPNSMWNMPVKCFAAGTPVLCPNGIRPIESIREGDQILAYDLDEQRIVESRVLRCEAFQGDFDMLDVEASPGNRFRVTTEHAFYNGDEWLSSNDLVAGERILDASGSRVAVSATGPERHHNTTTYNLRTEHKTYLVASTGLVVADRGIWTSRRSRITQLADVMV